MRSGALKIARSLALFLVVAGAAACASTGSGSTDSRTARARVDVDVAIARLQAAQTLYDAGNYDASGAEADSLYRAWRDQPSLEALADRALLLVARSSDASGLIGRAGDQYADLLAREPGPMILEDAVRRFAEILALTGRPAAAIELALDNPGILDAAGLENLRQWAAGLTLDELQDARAGHEPQSVEAQIVYVHLSESLAAAGQLNGARRFAQEVLDAGASEPERSTAEMLVGLEDGTSMTTARIGAILPLSGDLANLGRLLREGIDLALEGYARDHPDGFDIEFIVRDDASDPDAAAGLVEELEEEGVIAIIGPLRSESFANAARARRNPRLPILSPTATEVFGAVANAYTLYGLDQRELDVATDLARWTVEELGLRTAALLRPPDPALARAATLFGRAFEAAGGRVVASASYGGGSTLQESIERLAAAAPDVVFAPAESGPAVLTLAPQLVYYGLDRSIILGSEAWADPAVLRRLDGFAADYRVVGLWADRSSPGTPWQRFVAAYERKYRRSLRDNILPGLAHDAVLLVLTALEAADIPIPAALSARLSGGLEAVGVTGRLRPNAETSTVRRQTEVRMLLSGALQKPDRARLLTWLAEARAAPRPRDER
ncbi:MAG: ABC transporter substrate-binding protein [Gemmatimonadota bacterium]